MGKLSMTGFSEVEAMLGKLAKPEKIAALAVEKASAIMEDSLKTEIRKAANRRDRKGKPYSSGDLASSIRRTEPKQNERGIYSVVRPTGSDKKGLRNAQKMAYLEYGVASHGQEPRPVRQKAVRAVEAECEAAMRETVYSEVDKL